MGEEQQHTKACPLLGIRAVPKPARGISPISGPQAIEIDEHFRPCLGERCAWFLPLNEHGAGSCSITIVAANMLSNMHVTIKNEGGE